MNKRSYRVVKAGESPLAIYEQYLQKFMSPNEDRTFRALIEYLDSGRMSYVSASIGHESDYHRWKEVWVDYELKYGDGSRALWHTVISPKAARAYSDGYGIELAKKLITAFDSTYKKVDVREI